MKVGRRKPHPRPDPRAAGRAAAVRVLPQQVVLRAAGWSTVRENGRKLGDLSNGAFFTPPVDPALEPSPQDAGVGRQALIVQVRRTVRAALVGCA